MHTMEIPNEYAQLEATLLLEYCPTQLVQPASN